MLNTKVLKDYPLRARICLFFLLLLLILSYFFSTCILSSLPQTEGALNVSGPLNSLKIIRSKNGVVSIEGENDADVFFAMGFVHAQDRMWQLELQRRIASGRLSELLGKEAVDQDIWFRTLGVYDSAKKAWGNISLEARQSLTSYTKGVNAWLKLNKTLPLEFLFFNIEPKLWSEIDSLAWLKIFALNLSNSMWHEVERNSLLKTLSNKQFKFFFNEMPTYTESNNYNDLFGIKDKIKKLSLFSSYDMGSNAWVVSGKLTQDGLPILANDAHLGLQIPSVWYVVKLRGASINVSGMSLVGLPIVVFGKNNNLAWGGTSMQADVQDLYMIHINPSNSNEYLYDNMWKTFGSRIETIKVRADFPAVLSRKIKPLKIKIRTTIHGPIISDHIEGFRQPVSLNWTGLNTNIKDTTYEAFYRLTYAKNQKMFIAAMKYHVAPTLNMLYMDINNNIGYLGVGKIPIRQLGEGKYPVPGWDKKSSWKGYISFEDMPKRFNPSEGYIINANNKVVSSNSLNPISGDWSSNDRLNRINRMINDALHDSKISIKKMEEIQSDTIDANALKLINLLNDIECEDNEQKLVLGLLKHWDGDMNKKSQAASIFYIWKNYLVELIFKDEMAPYWEKDSFTSMLNNFRAKIKYDEIYEAIANNDDYEWCNNIHTKITESCDEIIKQAMKMTIAKLKKIKGDNVEGWKWGDIHSSNYTHYPFSNVNILDIVFGRRVESGGSDNTVNLSNATFHESKGYLQNVGASFRQIMQVSRNGGLHYYMNSTGQSGNVISRHYDDMVKPLNENKYQRLDVEFSGDGNKHTLQLVPEKNENSL